MVADDCQRRRSQDDVAPEQGTFFEDVVETSSVKQAALVGVCVCVCFDLCCCFRVLFLRHGSKAVLIVYRVNAGVGSIDFRV